MKNVDCIPNKEKVSVSLVNVLPKRCKETQEVRESRDIQITKGLVSDFFNFTYCLFIPVIEKVLTRGFVSVLSSRRIKLQKN